MRKVIRKFVLLAIAIVISAMTFSLGAQENPCLVRKIHVQVEDQAGNPIPGLTAASFKATIGKVEVPIRRVEPSPPLANLLLLLDTSGSRNDVFTMRSSLLIEKELINQSPRETRYASFAFMEETYLDQDFTSDRKLLDDAIQKYSARSMWRGPSAMYDALIFSINHIQRLGLPPGNSGIVLITDGGENDSHNNLRKTEDLLNSSGIRLFTVATISPDPARFPGAPRFRQIHELLDRLANNSGGVSIWLWPKDPPKEFRNSHREYEVEAEFNKIREIAADLIRGMASGYELELDLPSSVVKRLDWKLEIAAGYGPSGQRVSLRYAPRLFPCHTSTTGN